MVVNSVDNVFTCVDDDDAVDAKSSKGGIGVKYDTLRKSKEK